MTEQRPSEHEVDRPYKNAPGFSYVLSGSGVKHLYGAEVQPGQADRTVCGVIIDSEFRWAHRSMSLGKHAYCRECERIWKESK